MKTLYLSISVILFLMFGCMLNASGISTASESKIQLLTGKPTYVPGEKVQIIGAFNPNDLIHIDLVNPFDGTKNSTLLQSDNTGHFRTNYIVPYNAVNGTWKILATSGYNHASLDIQVISSNYGLKNKNTTHGYNGSVSRLSIEPPLKQFKSGVAANDVICRPDMQLLIQNQENFPICVKLSSVSNLLRQDWSYPTNCKYAHNTFTAGVAGLIMIEKNASDPSSDKSYSPRNSTVVIGWNNTISWINQDVTPSSVTSDWNLFDSGPILPGADWHHSFECAGSYGYHSEPHPWMKGWIRVLLP